MYTWNLLIGQLGRVFANSPGDLHSIPGRTYQRLGTWYLITHSLTLSNIRWGLRINWSNPGKRVAPTPIFRWYWKGSLLIALDYGRQLYLYMDYFKEMALTFTSQKPSMWLKYADETFLLWSNQEDVQVQIDHVDSIHPSGVYLNFNSHHPYNVKKGIVRRLQHRANIISSNDVYQEEIGRLRYPPSWQLPKEDNITSKKSMPQDKIEPEKLTVCLTYIKGLAEKKFRKYIVCMISGQHSGVAQLFVNISSVPNF